MPENLLTQGLELMLYGMGTVIVFLTLLVIATTAMSGLIARYFPEAPAASARPPAARQKGSGAEAEEELVAVISAAIARHRRR